MIPFEEIDTRLEALGKDRVWLAEISGRSPHSVRAALAPNALPKSRSELIQKALSDAIYREEDRQQAAKAVPPMPIPQNLVLTLTDKEFNEWSAAQIKSGMPTLKDWATAALNSSASRMASSVLRTEWDLKGWPPPKAPDKDEDKELTQAIQQQQQQQQQKNPFIWPGRK